MSWDAVLLRIKGPLRAIEEVEDEDYLPLGKRKDVITAISTTFPASKRQTPTQLLYRDGDLSISFALQGRDPVDSVLLEVRGEGDPITPLMELATRNAWVVLDASTSEFLDPNGPSADGYGGYRRLVKGMGRSKPRRPRKT